MDRESKLISVNTAHASAYCQPVYQFWTTLWREPCAYHVHLLVFQFWFMEIGCNKWD
jgi:hypothetical protein